MTRHDMDAEAAAFDSQIRQRVDAGHIPDLRHCGRCEWFRNNPWRDRGFIDLVYGERFRWLAARLAPGLRILEVGCGPGYLSLELARAGHDVVGLDISQESLDVARRTAAENPPQEGRVVYVAGDYLTLDAGDGFDVVVFNNALHHFSAQQQAARRARALLGERGQVVVMEPCRERMTAPSAAVWLLVETLLSAGGLYYETAPLLASERELQERLDVCLRRGRYEDEAGNPVQSPNDLAATHEGMLAAMEETFDTVDHDWEGAFYAGIIGGLRCAAPEDEVRLARHIRLVDRFLVESGTLPAVGFRWRGRVRQTEGDGRA